ncbi:MAG: MSHA biogenesis protein MshN, partial [Aestuariibacter sp.]|nr:MSHA biogenesis protein MshN [Aestuariibacter sp.]
MSVVNKMLNDLEQRESSEVTQANYQPPAKKPVPVRLLIIILVGVIAIGAALFWPV